jgi:hypothetical protein
MAYLEALRAPDLGTFINGEDFAAVQDMNEEFRQEVAFRGGFGSDGPIVRMVRGADENTISFSALLLRAGVARGLNDEDKLKGLRDFEVMTRRGEHRSVYTNCNWTRIGIASGLDQVMLTCDITTPGFVTA